MQRLTESVKTRVREPDPGYDVEEARGLFVDMSMIMMPYLERSQYSLSYITTIFQCFNVLQISPTEFSYAALEEATALLTQATRQAASSVHPGAYCSFLQAISHPTSVQTFLTSSLDTQTKIEQAGRFFSPRMSLRQMAVSYSCLVKLDLIPWESPLAPLLISRLKVNDWAREADSLVQVWIALGSLMKAGPPPPAHIETQALFAKALLSRIEALSIKNSLSTHQMRSSMVSSVFVFKAINLKPSSQFVLAAMTAFSSKENSEASYPAVIADLMWCLASLRWLPSSKWLSTTLISVSKRKGGTIEDSTKLAWALSELFHLRALELEKMAPALKAPFEARKGIRAIGPQGHTSPRLVLQPRLTSIAVSR